MKLIDILARELKVWPVSVEAIEQDIYGRGLYEYQGPPIKENVSEIAEDAKNAFVTRAQWQAAIEAIADQNSETPWNGEGLPPVGTEFESKVGKEWCECIAVAHDRGIVVFRRYFKGSEYGLYGHCYAGSDQMRPIRTAEQIAAEERLAGIKEIDRIATSGAHLDIPMRSATALWDAGYRKQVSQ